jgi:arylsulfatase A-like enzyme
MNTCLRLLLLLNVTAVAAVDAADPRKPNIVFVITDDQGYDDLGFTGNPVVKTPHIDRLATESSQLKDYHVAPTCSPTRAALLTGHWTNRTGVWDTVNGRSMLRENEVTLGQLLKAHGYATGMFGEWHLGGAFNCAGEQILVHEDAARAIAFWKLLVSPKHDHVELYDLRQDPLEKWDLSQSHPDVVTQLRQKLDAWHATLPAQPSGAVFSKERAD